MDCTSTSLFLEAAFSSANKPQAGAMQAPLGSYSAPCRKFRLTPRGSYCLSASAGANHAAGGIQQRITRREVRKHSNEANFHDYNAAWKIREQDPLARDPNGVAIVIGAGVAGLATALGLAKWGMSVQVRGSTHACSEAIRGYRIMYSCRFMTGLISMHHQDQTHAKRTCLQIRC